MRTCLAFFMRIALSSFQAAAQDPEVVSRQAIQELKKGDSLQPWALLKQSVDNTVRTFVVRDIPRLGVDPEIVIRRLTSESDPSVRRSLILALGGYDETAIPPAQRRRVIEVLLKWYGSDSDAGIHSAIAWLLSGGTGRPSVATGWNQTAALQERDRSWRGRIS